MDGEPKPIYQDRESGRAYDDAASMINDYIARFGTAVSKAQGVAVQFPPLDDDGYTSVVRGDVTVGVNVLESHGILLFLSRIMDVPDRDETTFYRKLLELNYLVTSDAAFAVDKDSNSVYLRALRRLSGLDYEEFLDILDTVARVADEWHGKLLELFGDDD
jgi:hypothetical protein